MWVLMDDIARLSGGRHAFPEENPQEVRMDLIKPGAGVTSKSHM